MSTIRRLLKWTAGLAVAALALASHAQDFPSRPVTLIVPHAPGGASDALARIIGEQLSTKWGQPVVVENRVGAGGIIGMRAVAESPANGYTLLMSHVGTHASIGALHAQLPFDPEQSFSPVAGVATLPFVVVARRDAPFKSVAELVQAAKSRELTYGSAGNGTVNHLMAEMFSRAAGIQMRHVPYRGVAAALTDLLGGHIDLAVASLPSVAGHIREGRLTAIALTSAQRLAGFPNIPTIAESGFRDFYINAWFGLFAPANTPAAVVRKINADVNRLLAAPALIDRFAAVGAEPYVTDPATFGNVLRADIRKWGGVVKAAGIRVE
jgi:tripartite-type tricarboxylate transporter receptor subunit TctC